MSCVSCASDMVRFADRQQMRKHAIFEEIPLFNAPEKNVERLLNGHC